MQGILTSEIRGKIEEILRSPNSIDPDVFHELASAYADLVIQINRRVAICNQWIDEGLRSEAIHMASLTPDLLQAVGQLDLGDSLEAWTVLCEANNAPVPPTTSWGLAAYLNESWELEDRLWLELQALRKSMLQHDTIKNRIQILRRIREHDGDNPIWQLTISEHEVKRVEEIQDQLDVAIEKNDLIKIGDIKSELLSADWIEPPPIELIDLSITAKKSIKTTHTTSQFKKVARKLFKAMSEGDEKKARALASKWESSIQGGLTAPQSALEDAIPVFEWLDKLSAEEESKAEFENLCDQLMQALDNQAPIEELETICNKLERMEFGIPSILENRYLHRCESFNRSAKQKNLLKIIVGSVAIFAIVAVVLILNQRADEINKITSFQDELKSAIESQNISRIERLLETKDSSILSEKDGRLIAEWEHAERLIGEDELRQKEFSSLLGKLGSLSPIAILDSSLDDLDELARTDLEKTKSSNLRESSIRVKTNHDKSIRIEIDKTLLEVSDEFEAMQRQLDVDSSAIVWEEFDDNIRSIGQKASAIQKQIDELFFPAIVQERKAKTLKAEIAKLNVNATVKRLRSEEVTKTLESLLGPHSIEDHMNYIDQLAANDDFEYSDEIEAVKDSGSAVNAIIAWNTVCDKFPTELSDLHRDDKTTELILSVIKNLGTGHPYNKSIEKIKEYLDSIVRIQDPKNSPSNQLGGFLGLAGGSVPLWADARLKRVVTEKGNYYGFKISTKDIVYSEEPFLLVKDCIFTTEDIEYDNSHPVRLPPVSSKIVFAEPTGFRQWKAKVESNDLLNNPPSDATDLWYLDLLLELAQINDVEPLVRYALTSRIAKLHQTNAWRKFNAFESIAKDKNYIPGVTWFNPNDFKPERKSKTKLLEGFDKDSIEKLKHETKQKYNDLEIPDRYVFIGHVRKSQGKLTAELNVVSPPQGNNEEVYVLEGAGDRWKLNKIGTLINQQIKLDTSSGNIKFGAPLFIVKPKLEQQ